MNVRMPWPTSAPTTAPPKAMNTSVERTQWRPGQLELVHLVDPLAGHSRQVEQHGLRPPC